MVTRAVPCICQSLRAAVAVAVLYVVAFNVFPKSIGEPPVERAGVEPASLSRVSYSHLGLPMPNHSIIAGLSLLPDECHSPNGLLLFTIQLNALSQDLRLHQQAIPRDFVLRAGLEPAITTVKGWRLNQLVERSF